MIKIAICDDDQILSTTIEKYINMFSRENGLDIETKVFYCGEDIVEYLKKDNKFDLIILDIELKILSGIGVGKCIREELCDDITQILYISSTQSYAMQLFINRPLNFLLKPLREEEFKNELNKAIRIITNSNECFEFQYDRTFFKIPYKDIIYFESDDKKVKLHSVISDYEFYGKLCKIARAVPQEEFFFIHKSYLVNYLHIKKSDYETVTLFDGSTLPISQSNRKDIRAKLVMRRKGR